MNFIILQVSMQQDSEAVAQTVLKLNQIADISQIVYVVLVALGLIYGIYQHENNKKHLRIAKSAELSREYASELIVPISHLTASFYGVPVLKGILEKIDLNKISHFDNEELHTFLGDEEIEMMIAFSRIVRTNNAIMVYNAITTLANKIEYFSICFNSRIADDETVYQSLHQTFFETINVVYLYISVANTSETDKVFTNTIKLYKRWRAIYKKQKRKEDRRARMLEMLEKIMQKTMEILKSKSKIPIDTKKA